MKKPSPYIEHIFQCSLTGRDPHPDAKRYERMMFWDEIINNHIRGTEMALRMSREMEAAIRRAAKEVEGKEANQETKTIQIRKEEES